MSYRQQFGRIARTVNPMAAANQRALSLVFVTVGGLAVGTTAPNISYTGPGRVEVIWAVGLFLLVLGFYFNARAQDRVAAEEVSE